MMETGKYPIFKLLLPYITGVVVSYLFDFQINTKTVLLFVAVSLSLLTVGVAFFKSYRMEFVQFVMLGASFVLLGVTLTNFRLKPPDAIGADAGNYFVRLLSEPTLREKSVKFEAEVFGDSPADRMNGKILLYFTPDGEASRLRYGDVLLVHTRLSRIEPPCNPDAFDNQAYMRRRGIHFTGFVRAGGWEVVAHKPANLLLKYAQDTRRKFTAMYETSGMSGDEFDILKAILLGDDDTLDPELKKSYAEAGVSHILCVSGMHVGVIFMIISFLTKPLDLFPLTKMIKSGVVVLIIWSYAHITGLAPSVTRSATMFTFVTCGQLFRRNTDVFHSLFASIFILLTINPLLLFEVGFQLSYLAIFGIVLFQPKLSGLYRCRTKIGNYFWELFTVSVAAQLGTSPISIYYFAQFPNCFMLSNLCVIALSFVIVITGVALLPASLIPFSAKIVSSLLTFEIRIMNTVTKFISGLPYSVTQNIDYNIFQVLILYLVIAIVCAGVYKSQKVYFRIACAFFAIFMLSFPAKKLMMLNNDEFLAYHLQGGTALQFEYRGQAVIFSDTISGMHDKLYEYNIKTHNRRRLLKPMFVDLDTISYDGGYIYKKGNFIRYMEKNYMILDRTMRKLPTTPPEFVVDCVILRGNPKISPEELAGIIGFKAIVADGSNTKFYIEKWRKYCSDKGIPYIITSERKNR